ncbi:MAG: PIN domain-containing protein [Anaerolineae bacterium]
MSIILIDTNLLLYAYDVTEPGRSGRAQAMLDQLKGTGLGRLSVQCLAEFFSISTRKLKPPLTRAQALTQIALMGEAYPVLDLTLAIVLEATRGARDHQLAYYDAQIWATAKLNQIPVIFSEDFPSADVLEGVRFVNPFAADFDLDNWI